MELEAPRPPLEITDGGSGLATGGADEGFQSATRELTNITSSADLDRVAGATDVLPMAPTSRSALDLKPEPYVPSRVIEGEWFEAGPGQEVAVTPGKSFDSPAADGGRVSVGDTPGYAERRVTQANDTPLSPVFYAPERRRKEDKDYGLVGALFTAGAGLAYAIHDSFGARDAGKQETVITNGGLLSVPVEGYGNHDENVRDKTVPVQETQAAAERSPDAIRVKAHIGRIENEGLTDPEGDTRRALMSSKVPTLDYGNKPLELTASDSGMTLGDLLGSSNGGRMGEGLGNVVGDAMSAVNPLNREHA